MNNYVKLLAMTIFSLQMVDAIAACGGTPSINVVRDVAMGMFVAPSGDVTLTVDTYGFRSTDGLQLVSGGGLFAGEVTVEGPTNCDFSISVTDLNFVSAVAFRKTGGDCTFTDGTAPSSGKLTGAANCVIAVGAKATFNSGTGTGSLTSTITVSVTAN